MLVNTPNPYGNTPLHLAVRGALNATTDNAVQMQLHMELLAVLLGAGSDPYHKNLEGQTPLTMVERKPQSELCRRIRRVLLTTRLKYEDGGIYLCPDPDPLEPLSVADADPGGGGLTPPKPKRKEWVYRWAENERVHLPSPVEGQKDEDTLERLYCSHYTNSAPTLGTTSLRTELSVAFAQRSSLKSLILGAHAQAPPPTTAFAAPGPTFTHKPARRRVQPGRGRGTAAKRPHSAYVRPKESVSLRPSTATGRDLLRHEGAKTQSSLLHTQHRSRSVSWAADARSRPRPRPRPASAALRSEGRPRPATAAEAEDEADAAVHKNFCRKVCVCGGGSFQTPPLHLHPPTHPKARRAPASL